jgi:hypothetical protein
VPLHAALAAARPDDAIARPLSPAGSPDPGVAQPLR